MVALTVHYTDYTEVRVVRHSDVTWRGTPDIESQVANYILRSQENPNWSNEPLVRVNTSRIIGCQLQLETSLTDYAHHVVTRSTVEDDLRANGLYVSAMLRTLDKQFLFARRADVDIRRNRYNIVAGGVNPTTDMVLSKPSLQRGLQRELREEFGPVIAGSAFSYIPRMIFGIDSQPAVSHLSEILLGMHSDRAVQAFNTHVSELRKEGKQVEMDAIRVIPATRDGLQREIEERYDEYTPSVQALLSYIQPRL